MKEAIQHPHWLPLEKYLKTQKHLSRYPSMEVRLSCVSSHMNVTWQVNLIYIFILIFETCPGILYYYQNMF